MYDDDDYEVWLESYEPGPLAKNAMLPHNISDPVAQMRMLNDFTGKASLERSTYSLGQKHIDNDEKELRHFGYFQENQESWAAHFEDYLLCRGVPKDKIHLFQTTFAGHWLDGARRRQNSQEILAIKASIRDLDQIRRPNLEDKWVINKVNDSAKALFTPDEMEAVFEANSGLIDAFLPDYVENFSASHLSVPSDLYVRRGVYMPEIYSVRFELHYLSSYSLALGPAEQFAQTWTSKTRDKGVPTIYSAPLSAVQERIVAFAPFIKGMSLSQLELVVAPPISNTPLIDYGLHGDIHEFGFE